MGPRPKVCHITSVHPPFDPRIFHKECRTLAAAGYEVVLVAPHDHPTEKDGVRIHPIPKLKVCVEDQNHSRWARRTVGLWRTYRAAAAEKADLYHFHDPELIPVGLLLKLQFRVPVLFDVHEHYSETLPIRMRIKFGINLVRLVCRLLLERLPLVLFDRLVFPTYSLERAYRAPARTFTVLNLPLLRDQPKVSPTLSWERREFDVVFLGSITPERMRFALAVLQHLVDLRPDCKWLFVGIAKEIEDWTRQNYDPDFLRRHLVMVNYVPFEKGLEYLGQARVGFNHRPKDKRYQVAIPMKVLEYMQAGLPMVTTTFPDLSNLLTDNRNAVLLDSQEPLDYAQAIARLLKEPKLAQAIGVAGRELIQTQLNWECLEAPKLVAAYGKLLRWGP